jgi:hypothetical protein
MGSSGPQTIASGAAATIAFANSLICSLRPPKPPGQVLALDEAGKPQLIKEGDNRRHFPRAGNQNTEASGARRLLRPHAKGPHSRRAAENGNEVPSLHPSPVKAIVYLNYSTTGLVHSSNAKHYSITSSARATICVGIVRPSALAVLRLTASSTLVDCWTGRSAGFSPLRIRPA